ncbi:MAG: hypothetical protein ACJAYB_003512 [Psychromonas sp.]|jgi:hypothetical protein
MVEYIPDILGAINSLSIESQLLVCYGLYVASRFAPK